MVVEVITYEDPKGFRNHPLLERYSNCLHLCATKNLRDGVFEQYQKTDNLFITAPILTFSSFFSQLFSQWENPTTKLEQFLKISKSLKNLENRYDSTILKAFRRNQNELLDTIRSLEFAGIAPCDMKNLELTTKEELFIEIWERTRSHDSFTEFQENVIETFHSYWAKNKISILNNSISKQYMKGKKKPFKQDYEHTTIILHGFYFITTAQQRVFRLLNMAGVRLVFLNLYMEGFPQTFGFIKDFINKQNGWIDFESTKNQPKLKIKSIVERFLNEFEGKSSTEQNFNQVDKVNIFKLKQYDHIYQFLTELLTNTDATYIAPNANSLNERLEDFKPELFKKKRKFLSYPIGRFFYQLHHLWDENLQKFTIDASGLFECFSSGWLYDKETKQNARDYTQILDKIIVFFDGCVTIEKWQERVVDLGKYYDEVILPFSKSSDDRFQRMMRSPFSRISHFTVEKKDVEQVLKFINEIFKIASNLFGDGTGAISIHKHFKKIEIEIEKIKPYLNMNEDEEKLLTEIQIKLKKTPDLDEFMVDDICYAIQLYLSGKLDKRDEDVEPIRPFIEVDGEVFKDICNTHVTGMDENSLPYGEFTLPWPLSKPTFEGLAEHNEFLSMQILRNNNVKPITRYLMFQALQYTEGLTFSWIKNYEDKENLDMAIYLKQLNIEVTPEHDLELELEELDNDFEYCTSQLESMPIDSWAEFLYCPRRFYYSALASEYAIQSSDFIHQFMFGDLVKVLRNSTNLSNKQIQQELFKLFPYWTEYKKRLLFNSNIAYSLNNFKGQYIYKDGESFTDMRKLFLFPLLLSRKTFKDDDSKKVALKIKDLYSSKDINAVKRKVEQQFQKYPLQLEATPNNNCRYCPHMNICQDAYHPVDDKQRRL